MNGRIVFTSFRDGRLGDIWTMNPDGTALRKLTSDPAGPALYDAQADWSPDGRWIAFRRGPDASTRLGVWKMTLYGGDPVLLAEGNPAMPRENATQPAWAPDARSILFRANRPPFTDTDIWEMAPDGSNQRLVVHLPGEQLYPSYSPDKSRIAYTTPRVGRDRGIFTIAADGSNAAQILDVPGAYDSAPNWSPDGMEIAFESDSDGDMEIYVMNADGTNVRQLTDNDIHDEGPSWSPDGRRIVFTSGPGDLEGDIYVMDADGSNRLRIMDSPGRDESPDWQPIPHSGDYTACGDLTHVGAGAYSVKAAGRGLDCEKALAIAGRWSEDALAGARDDSLEGFLCETADAGYGALMVECSHRGNRSGDRANGRRSGNHKSILLVWRAA
jgi:TolB protein